MSGLMFTRSGYAATFPADKPQPDPEWLRYPRPCPKCDAGRWELCRAPTGLPASGPHAERLREEKP